MHDDDVIQLVTFRVGAQEFAIDILQLQRILRYERPAPLPDAPPFLEGVIAHDGGAVPVVDLRTRLGYPATLSEDTRLMVLDLDGQRVAVVVDAAREIVRVESTAIAAPPPMVRGLAARYIAGLYTRADRTIVILNASRILSATEQGALRELEATP